MDRTERQYAALRKWQQNNCKGSLVMCTGFGKTNTALLAIKAVSSANPGLSITVIVPTKVLKEQWEAKIQEKELNIPINVVIINTAIKKPFICDFLILDEAHRYNADSFSQIFYKCNPTFILGLTATYERLDNKEKEIMDNYCPPCDSVSVEEAVAEGWLAPYYEYKVVLNVDLTAYNEANKAFLNHFAFFNFDFDVALQCVQNFYTQAKVAKALNCSVTDVRKHAYAWMKALQFRKQFIANHPYKMEIANKIINARKDKKIITFNTSIKQCEAYKTGSIVHSGKGKKVNQKILEDFAKQSSGVIHSAKLLEEGLDCPGLSVAIITGFNSSKIKKVQRTGRCIRAEKGKTAEIFTLLLKGTVEEKWFDKSTENLQYIEINEQELDKVLNYEELNNKTLTRSTKQTCDLLRF